MKELPAEFGKGNLDAKKFWMAPDGTFYGVKYEWSHPGWVSQLYKFLKLPPPSDASDEMYKKGWVRIITGFEGQTYTLWYEHRHKPLSGRLKNEIRNLAIELRVMQIKDREGRNQEYLPESRTVSKSILKDLIRQIITVNEVTQKDLKQRHPNNPDFFDKDSIGRPDYIGGWDISKLTLDNLAALKRKIRDSIKYLQNHPSEFNDEWLKGELEQYNMVDWEMKDRLHAINKPVNENQKPELKSKFFTVKFGEPNLPPDAGKIFFRDVWFANAVKITKDWDEKHADTWYLNRHAGAFQMGLPSITYYFKSIEEMLAFLDKWIRRSGNLKEDLQQRHNQVGSQSQCTGMSHGTSNDYNDVQMTRDQLNDPMLNGKLHEISYRFDDFPETKRGDGFGMAINVYYGTVFLGIIVSQPEGYLIGTVRGPDGKDRSYRHNIRKPFKTKLDAANALHRAWKMLRHREPV